MISHWAYILIGDNDTGKTSFQKHLLEMLCDFKYVKLPINTHKPVSHPRAPRHFNYLSTMNRSYQEKKQLYGSVQGFFRNHFKDADVCILSSHAHGNSIDDIREMIDELNARAYNVGGVFWSNSFNKYSKEISKLPWQERLWLRNPVRKRSDAISKQIHECAYMFSDMLIEKSRAR